MRKLLVFNHVSLDGYFADRNGDMSWAKADHQDPEWDAFVAGNASGGGALVFGRITYQMMAGFWPTPLAMEMMPVVARAMNRMPKIVFSRTLDTASWSNTTVVTGDIIAAVRRLKSESGPGMTILGSGSIVAQLAPAGVIDEYQVVVNPLALGKGRTMFDGLTDTLALKLSRTHAFDNGNVLLCYEPRP
jgi:dihydrofolate reductase